MARADMSEVSYKRSSAPSVQSVNRELAQNYQTAASQTLGEQFVFIVKNPVSLQRRQSAMIPLVQSDFSARKVSIFSANAQRGVSANPVLGVELKNSLGMKLPAGPIVVYDGGSYAGDSLIEFFGENEKRLISYGDDQSVTGVITNAQSAYLDTVKIAKGVLHINHKNVYTKSYIFKNSSSTAKSLIVEHPLIINAKLVEPSKFSEKTGVLYRFDLALPANKETKFSVKEELPSAQTVAILGLEPSVLIAYANGDFPASVKEALSKAAEYANAVSKAKSELSAAQNLLKNRVEEQNRIRANLQAVGRETAQGKDYLTRMTTIDKDIDSINANIDALTQTLAKEQKSQADYIGKLSI